MFMQRPLQQVSPIANVSPSTRHAVSSWQTRTLLSPRGAQVRPQHSSLLAHGSPAGRQSGGAAHVPAMQAPLQQSWATMQGWPADAQPTPPQIPAAQPSAQQVPAAVQLCSLEEQPAGLAQARRPVPAGSGAQTNEQQSAPTAQSAPSVRQAARAQRPSTHEPEQQSPDMAQAPPLAAQLATGSERGMVNSTSRRQATASAANDSAATRRRARLNVDRRRRACAPPARRARAGTP